jgi:hypothetical protein
MKELTEDFEILIIAWLKSEDENVTNLAHSLYKIAKDRALNMHIVGREFKDKKTLTFDEFLIEFGLEADRDNEYFFDNDYYTFEGLYYKYAEYFDIKP